MCVYSALVCFLIEMYLILLVFSHSVMSNSLRLHGLQHTRRACPSPSPWVCSLMSVELVTPSNSLILWITLLLLPSIFPSIRVFFSESALCIRWPKYWSFSFSISPSNERSGLFPLGLTGLISLQSKGLSRVFANTTVQKHQFFDAQPFLWSTSHIHTWLLEKTIPFDYMDLCQQSNVSFFKALSRFVITSLQRS